MIRSSAFALQIELHFLDNWTSEHEVDGMCNHLMKIHIINWKIVYVCLSFRNNRWKLIPSIFSLVEILFRLKVELFALRSQFERGNALPLCVCVFADVFCLPIAKPLRTKMIEWVQLAFSQWNHAEWNRAKQIFLALKCVLVLCVMYFAEWMIRAK